MVTKLKNSNGDKTQKQKLWQNSKTPIVKNHLKKSSCDKTKIGTKLKLWQNSKSDQTQTVTKLKNANYDRTQKLKLWQKNVIKHSMWQFSIYDKQIH